MLPCQSIAHCPPVWTPLLQGTDSFKPRLLHRREYMQLDDIQEPSQAHALSVQRLLPPPHAFLVQFLGLCLEL